jgi:hypothetical protein
MNFTEWISSTAGTTALLAALGYIFRHWIIDRLSKSVQHEYDLKLSKHEADLKRDYDVQIEKLRAQLQIANVRFAHIFVKQAEVIAQLHAKVVPLLNGAKVYITVLQRTPFNSPERKEPTVKLDALRSDYYSYFLNNIIYFDEDTAKLIRQVYHKITAWAERNSMHDSLSNLKDKSEHSVALLEKMGTEIDAIEDEINKLIDALVKKFQSIIGVQQ